MTISDLESSRTAGYGNIVFYHKLLAMGQTYNERLREVIFPRRVNLRDRNCRPTLQGRQ